MKIAMALLVLGLLILAVVTACNSSGGTAEQPGSGGTSVELDIDIDKPKPKTKTFKPAPKTGPRR